MRLFLIVIALILLSACSSKKPTSETTPDVVNKTGVIVAKQVIPIQDIEDDSFNVDTRIFASIFSGGRISLGLGFLFSPSSSHEMPQKPVRYEVKMEDGSEIILYSESYGFEIDDCVDITIHKDVENHPPQMERNKDGCG